LKPLYCSLCSQRTGGQSGRGADDPRERISAQSAATGAVVDLVRQWVVYRREVTCTPLRTLAAEIGITRSALDRFHKVRSRPGKNWPKLRDWYMRTRESRARDEYQTPPEELLASALHTLTGLPNSERARAVRIIANNYRALYVELNQPLPEWVMMLTEVADRGDDA
jgi:hypothetical protein